MELQGKAKEAFEKWLLIWIQSEVANEGEKANSSDVQGFYEYPDPMKYGVIVDFFDQCEVEGVEDTVQLENSYIAGGHTREEARNFAVEKNEKRFNQDV